MYATQKQVIESFVRVRAFLDEHPATGVLTYRGAQETLVEVLDRVWGYAGTQISGRVLSRAELRHQRLLMKRLRDRHMRPMVTIARAQVEPHSDVRLPVAFRMPKVRIGVTKMLQACDGMIEAAKPFEAVLIEHGLPSDFLARFKVARDELDRTFAIRATLTGSHIAARKGLQVELSRGRRAIDRLDAVVRVAFEGDEERLATWRSMKRVHRLPSGARTRASEDAVADEERDLVLALVPTLQPAAMTPTELRSAA